MGDRGLTDLRLEKLFESKKQGMVFGISGGISELCNESEWGRGLGLSKYTPDAF